MRLRSSGPWPTGPGVALQIIGDHLLELTEIHVSRRNLRWEVSIAGVTRPLVDWFYSRERALEHAAENARLLGVPVVCLNGWDGALEAKIRVEDGAVEDTAFYRYSRLLCLNEVGSTPSVFGMKPAGFHAANLERLRS